MLQAKRKLLAFMKSDAAVKRQLQMFLFLARVYEPTRRTFNQRQSNKRDIESIDQEDDRETFKFPPFAKICRLYNVCSNILLSWVFFKHLVPGPFSQVSKWIYHALTNDDQMDSHCYVFGHFVLHYELPEELIGCMLASFHLVWRLAQWTLDRPFVMDVLLFLMQPAVNIERFIVKLNSLSSSSSWSLANGYQLTNLAASRKERRPSGQNQLTTANERLLCELMCYKVHIIGLQVDNDDHLQRADYFTGKFVYKLRPNRTLEAREMLLNWLVAVTVGATLVMGFLTIVLTLYICIVLAVNQYHYLNAYPGCDGHLARLLSEGNLTRWSTQLTKHHLVVLPFDVIENAVVWFESGMALIFLFAFVIYFTLDLLLYWTNMNNKLERLLLESRQMYHMANHNHHYSNSEVDDSLQKEERRLFGATFVSHRFEEEIYELQAEMYDFFHQINRVDLLVSDVITHALFIWLTCFGTLSYKAAENYSTSGNAGFGLVLVSTCLVVFLGYSAVSLYLLSLQKRCKSSYSSLCSLMAYDQSRHKRHFIEILRFYTTNNRNCYTLFQQYPFSTSTFVSIIGWSVTAFLVLDNINHH